ncbi:MAG: PKD domain-containing protein [bacterium]|nr:PKD domain-containing protein [bacterium]
MLFFRWFKICLIFVWVNNIFTQTNNFWNNYEQGFSFNVSGNLKYHIGLTNDYSSTNNLSIADFNGLPLLYTNGSNVYNFKNELIPNGVGLKSYFNNFNSSYFLTLDTSNFLMYGNGPSTNTKKYINDSLIYYSYIKRDFSVLERFSIPPNKKNILLHFNSSILCITTCRDNDAQPIMVFRTKKYFYSYKIATGGNFKILDSLYYPENKIIPDSLNLNPLLVTNGVFSEMQLSNNGEFIAFNDLYAFSIKHLSELYFASNNRFIMTFDKQTGKFGSPKMISTFFWHKFLTPFKNNNYYDGFCFSPNDSFLYYHDVFYDLGTRWSTHEDLYQYDVYGNASPQLIYKNITKNANNVILSLNHLGELFFFNRSVSGSQVYLNKIKQPNNKYPQCAIQLQSETVSTTVSIQPELINQHLYDYIRTAKQVRYDCVAKVDYKNKSQTWIGFTDFTWHIKNDKGGMDYYKSFEPPQLIYTKNGDYPVKLFAYSPKGKGCGEWFIDTIKIRIPEKPIANFYAKDSIVCRYTGLQFINYSNAKDTINNNYVWSFGDGNTSTEKSPSHVYTSPGTYTVILFYRNGYCDSTLTKNQYIKVVDAPKPGFSALYKQGCSPFTANFTDSVTLNVKQKDYYFSDVKLWQNITNPKFIHTFNTEGVYKAVQRLTGYSGCVIQTDSVIFNISKGLTMSDTLNIFNSSVENKHAVIHWNRHDAAVKYQLFKDGKPYIQQKDTFFNETTPYLKDAVYTVTGIDSCDNQSSTGRLGKPMLLHGNLIGNNEASVIFFSPYQQWKGTDITYKIQKLINNNWLIINSEKVNAPYHDDQFLNKTELQACYRIEAFENSQPALLSHSNELCIPYIPTLFIPTAFSPNNDLVNDVFDITGFGIEKYTFTVYNRWGQKVFNGIDKQSWDGSNASEGIYLILIEYTTNEGLNLVQRVNVTLIK